MCTWEEVGDCKGCCAFLSLCSNSGFQELGRGTGVGILLHNKLRYGFCVKITVLPVAVEGHMFDKVRADPAWPVVCEFLTTI